MVVYPSQGSRRVRVVTLVDFLGIYGGAERLALSVATRLDPERFKSTLAVSRWPPQRPLDDGDREALHELSGAGVQLLGLGRRGKSDVWVWGKLARHLRRERTDVLHAHKFGSNVWGTVVGTAARVPVVLAQEHSWDYEGQTVRRLLDRHVISRGADRFIAVSREDQRRMVEVEGIDRARTLFIPNAIAASNPTPGRDVRAELDIAPGDTVIGSVGTLRPVKAFGILVRATALLARDGHKVHVLIAGEGPDRPELEAMIRELGIGAHVSLLGRRSDVPDVLAALDIAVCCSYSEGCPLSVMEYMAAGLPVVATDVGGGPDLIDDGRQGLLVAPGDPGALASALAELISQPARATQLGERAAERQRTEFAMEVLIRRLEALYMDLLSEKRSRPDAEGGA